VNKPSGDEGDDQSFADVVNNLSSGPWRLGGRRKKQASSSPTRAPVAREEPVAMRGPASARAGSDEWNEPADSASVVRPYTWTRGRTAPVFDLAMETLVSTSERGLDMAMLTTEENRAVAELCRTPRSVAEVAALLSLPLGVARVLLADMAHIGLVMVHRNANGFGNRPDMVLMERVLSGLRRL
jgi:hypothetical protein